MYFAGEQGLYQYILSDRSVCCSHPFKMVGFGVGAVGGRALGAVVGSVVVGEVVVGSVVVGEALGNALGAVVQGVTSPQATGQFFLSWIASNSDIQSQPVHDHFFHPKHLPKSPM